MCRINFLGAVMYKVTIDISDWSLDANQSVTIESNDFEKVQIIQEFIEFQKEYGWAVDYEAVIEFDDEEDFDDESVESEEDESVEDEESEEFEIGETVEDEDGLVWQRVA